MNKILKLIYPKFKILMNRRKFVKDVFQPILLKLDEIEKTQSLEDFVLKSTNLFGKHTLIMKEDYLSFAPRARRVYQDLQQLELADFVDYEKFVGEFDGEYN